MRVALAQINSILGDFTHNKNQILDNVRRAQERRCDLVVFPEAALFGYHPVDLLERASIVKAQEQVLRELHKSIPKGMGVVVGAIVKNPSRLGKGFLNAAVFLERGKVAKICAKQLLPTYDVFDEGRHIEPGLTATNLIRFKGLNLLITICEDIWAWPVKGNPNYARYGKNPLLKIPKKSVDLVINLSASPFTHTKFSKRLLVVKKTATHFKAPLIYVNMVGAQDELIFDGGSFAVNESGRVVAQSVRFEEDLNVLELGQPKKSSVVGGKRELSESPSEIVRSALVLGIRDFAKKVGFKKAHIGLSGGIDSALVACLATDALGPMNVTAVSMPGPFSSPDSAKWAKILSDNLGIRMIELPISEHYQQLMASFNSTLGEQPFSIVNENVQSRLRGMLLMAVANREGSVLLGTTNKSEVAVGYGTLYGDVIGGLLPIGDLLKTEVFELSRHYNSQAEVIPTEIINRPPSAELRANQTDQDSLPPYEILDVAIKRLVEGLTPPSTDVERRVLDLMMKSEFKRWQAPPILKVSDHAFGRGRRFPIAHRATL